MQYFVSAENTSYFYWQLDLLIESFLMMGMEDSLVIGIADNESQKVTTFSKNLINHKNKFIHENVGEKEGYLPLNRIAGIRCALGTGSLEFPFAVVHADMVLKKPIDLGDEYCGAVLNNFDLSDKGENAEITAEVSPSIKLLASDRGVALSDVPEIPFISYPMVFTKASEYVSEAFFSKVYLSELEIFKRRGPNFPCEKAAWLLSLTECFQHFATKGKFMAAPILYDGDELNFIHYSDGIPPVFHKKYYHYKDSFYLAGADPYQVLLESGATVNSEHMKRVVNSYNKRNRS
jgi:hypothetical protein